nr:homeobox-leucine zipper protein HDG11-like isoform X2 [Solanum lycopersicum]
MKDSGEEPNDESSNSQRGSKRHNRHSMEQIQILEAFFENCPLLNENQQNQLAREAKLEPKQVTMWFQNKRTQIKCERVSKHISSVPERPSVTVSNLAPSKSNLVYPPSFGQEYNTNNNVQAHSVNTNNISIMSPSRQEHYELHDRQKTKMFEIVVASMNEMVELWKINDPIWVDSSSEGRCSIHRESYERIFPNPNRPYYQSSANRIESSKDCEVVSMTASELIHNFLDPVKWMELFPTIVTKARTVEVLDSGTWGGSIQLMYEKLHILSPLVEARDFFFIRSCRQFDPRTWIMMDVSYDPFNEIQSGVHSYSWKFPSGCAIQDIGNGQSKVTWVEHVQVYEKKQVHRIFRDLLCDRQTYGAKRWIVTLQRMSERYNFAMGAICPTRHDFNVAREGMKNTIQISQRMVKNFFEILSMTDNLDFPTSSRLNRGDRISIRINEEIIQPKGFIATAATSLWLPLSFQDVFNFFKDDKTRSQWDILTGGNNVIELARVLTGTLPENSITIIQPCMQKEMLVIQETSIDSMGAFLVYAPIDLQAITSIVNGGDVKRVPILPSGITISPDGRLSSDRDSTANAENGSILTVTFQILVSGHNNPTSQKQQMEVVASVHYLLSSIILKIKAALGCSDL